MAIKYFSLFAALTFSGCAMFDSADNMFGLDEQAQETKLVIEHPPQNIEDGSPLASSVNFHRQFKQNDLVTMAELETMLQHQRQQDLLSSKEHAINKKEYDINHYVRGLMQGLVGNLQYVNSTTPVAIASFVMLNSDYNESNLLGIQIAESLIHEVHKFGIPVIDFKTTGFIRITEQGDFAFSKDYEDLSGEMPARYIVSGTMLKHTDGYFINARIIGIQSQAVVASAQSFIPNSVSDPILIKSAVSKPSNLNRMVEIGSIALPVDNIAIDTPLNRISLVRD